MPRIEYIPQQMVRGNLIRGEILCRFVMDRNQKKIGVRMYRYSGYSKIRSVIQYENLETSEYMFASPKSRISTKDLEELYANYENFKKGISMASNAVSSNPLKTTKLDTMIRSYQFFKIYK